MCSGVPAASPWAERAALFADLHETITWHGDRLTATDPWDYSGSLSGEGLLLVPSAMAWPTVRKMVAPYQPVISYLPTS